MAPPLVGRKTRTLSASPDSSTGSNPRPFSFGDLGRARPRPPGARLLPPIKDPDSELELGADDIIESDEIDAFEAAAAEMASVEAPAPAPVPAQAAANSSGFEVGDLGAFDDIEVEGLATRASEPSPAPAPAAVIAHVEPVSIRVDYTSPQPSTLIGMPSAPITSPLPVAESVIANEPPAPERTLEMKGDALAKVAEQAAFLDGDMPERTQILVRSQMPASLRGPATLPTGHTPPTSVNTPSVALAATAAAWQNGHPGSGPMPVANAHGRPSSVAPVALDISRARPTMPSIPAAAALPRIHAGAQPAKSRTSGLLIGGLIFAAASLIGVVGVGGYIASRTLSDKAGSFATTPAPEPVSAAAAPADPAAADPAAAPADPTAAASPTSAGIDVSSLPSAPVRGAGGASAPVAAAPAVAAPGAAPAAAPRGVVGSNGGSRPSGGSSPGAPTGRGGAPLPPPGAANTNREAPLAATGGAVALPPPPKAAPPAAPVASSTGNVNVDPKLRAVVVDGAFRRVNDGVLTLSCGAHRIKVGMNDPQVVNVPCGGSVSL